MEQYYIIENETRKGPYILDDLIEMNLSKEILVWKKGLDNWVQLNDLEELKGNIPPPIPKTEPPPIPKSTPPDTTETAETEEKTVKDEAQKPEDNMEQTSLPSIHAGFWLRVLAFVIDFAIVSLLVFSFIILIMPGASDEDIESVARGLGVILGWLYYSLYESSHFQATPGKSILGLKVTDERFRRIGFGKATGRFFGKILSGLVVGIGYIMVGFTKNKQGLHDLLAKTFIIKQNIPGINRKTSSWVLLVMTVLLFLFSLLISANSDFFGNDTTKEVGVDNRYTIELPSFLTETNGLNDDASLQYQSLSQGFFVIIIDEPKASFHQALVANNMDRLYPPNLDGYTRISLDNLELGVAVTQKSESESTKINGMDARIISFTGRVDGTDIFYTNAFVEGKNRYYNLMVWSPEENKEKYSNKMKEIIMSFDEK